MPEQTPTTRSHVTQPSRFLRPTRRAPYRDLFVDHPGYAAGDPRAFAGTGQTRDKLKIWCKLCLERCIQSAMEGDRQELREGKRLLARSIDQILAERESSSPT